MDQGNLARVGMRERRTIFGMALKKRNPDGNISSFHFNLVYDAIFVKGALSYLFASGLFESFKICVILNLIMVSQKLIPCLE